MGSEHEQHPDAAHGRGRRISAAGNLAARAAEGAARVPGVRRVQKSMARASGSEAWVDMHVWVDGSRNVCEAHALAHRVKEAVRGELPRVRDVLVHVEPAAERAASVE